MNKNKTAFLFAAFLFCSALFLSCGSLGLYPSVRGWTPSLAETRTPGKTEKLPARIGNIRVDKNADWDSVEAETRRLLPLLLAGQGYGENGAEADGEFSGYTVDAVLVEREYMEKWKSCRSLAAEIHIRSKGKEILAAGKAVLSGKSLSSSEVLHRLLKCALVKALKALEK